MHLGPRQYSQQHPFADYTILNRAKKFLSLSLMTSMSFGENSVFTHVLDVAIARPRVNQQGNAFLAIMMPSLPIGHLWQTTDSPSTNCHWVSECHPQTTSRIVGDLQVFEFGSPH